MILPVGRMLIPGCEIAVFRIEVRDMVESVRFWFIPS